MLPFIFLTTSGHISDEVMENLVMVACQMIIRKVKQGGAEIRTIIGDVDSLWTVWAETEFKTFCIGPQVKGIRFYGWGGISEGRRILFPFKTTYLVDPPQVGIDLLKISANDPDGFLSRLKENIHWKRFFMVMMKE